MQSRGRHQRGRSIRLARPGPTWPDLARPGPTWPISNEYHFDSINQTTQCCSATKSRSIAAFNPYFKVTTRSIINTQVLPFKTTAFVNRAGRGLFFEVSNESLLSNWAVLIFMPAAFPFNGPAEIEDAADNCAEFQKAGAEVYIVTTDTHLSHKVWHETSAAVGKAKFPLVGDPTHTLTNNFGAHVPERGLALRGTFVIHPAGIIKTAAIHSDEIVRDVKETVRKLKAAQRL